MGKEYSRKMEKKGRLPSMKRAIALGRIRTAADKN